MTANNPTPNDLRMIADLLEKDGYVTAPAIIGYAAAKWERLEGAVREYIENDDYDNYERYETLAAALTG